MIISIMKDLNLKSGSRFTTIRFHHFVSRMSWAKSGPYFFFRARMKSRCRRTLVRTRSPVRFRTR